MKAPTLNPDDLKRRLTDDIAAAADLGALEAVRVACARQIGQRHRAAEDARRDGRRDARSGRAENPFAARERHGGDRRAQGRARGRRARPAAQDRACRPVAARARNPKGLGPPGQPGDGRARRDFRRLGLRRRRRARRSRTDWHNFTALNIPETHPARAMHDTFYMARRARPADGAAHPHFAGADPDDDGAEAADPDHRAGAGLSLGQRRHPHPDVPPDRGAGDRSRRSTWAI